MVGIYDLKLYPPQPLRWEVWLCRRGFHNLSRQLIASFTAVVDGYSRKLYVEHSFCSCGKISWLKYDDGYEERLRGEEGDHFVLVEKLKRDVDIINE